MNRIELPKTIDFEEYRGSPGNPGIKYGLPDEVVFCKRCVISNQRPNSAVEFSHTRDSEKTTIRFDDEGICDSCRLAEQKENIDWDERERELRNLCDRFRRNDGRYDCVVPGSGGKDSFFTAHKLKYEYGMHPLTVTWAPHKYTDWGWRNFQKWIHAGFDNNLVTPNGRAHRLLTRLATERLFHPFQPFVLGQKNLAPKMSVLYDVPLVFFGENEAEYGNPIDDSASAQRDWGYFTLSDKSGIYLGGVSVEDLTSDFGLDPVDLDVYMPADPERIAQTGTEVHYLGYYLKWHPQSSYYYAVEHGGFEACPERNPGTYSKYASIDDRIDDLFHYTYYIKFGFGRATHDAAQEIRCGDIERDEGVSLVRRYDGEYPTRFEKELFQYLSIPEKEFPVASRVFERPAMDREYFMDLANTFRSPHLWNYENAAWSLRHAVWHEE